MLSSATHIYLFTKKIESVSTKILKKKVFENGGVVEYFPVSCDKGLPISHS